MGDMAEYYLGLMFYEPQFQFEVRLKPKKKFTTVEELSKVVGNCDSDGVYIPYKWLTRDYIAKQKIKAGELVRIEEEVKMTERVPLQAPQFRPGEVIDFTYKTGGLPNRIKIVSVYHTDSGNGWMYNVILESDGCKTHMSESFILERICKKDQPVYELDTIKKRYDRGWRYCGKYHELRVREVADKIAKNSLIKEVRLTEAYYPNGRFADYQLAIWIRYNNPIACQDVDSKYINIKVK